LSFSAKKPTVQTQAISAAPFKSYVPIDIETSI